MHKQLFQRPGSPEFGGKNGYYAIKTLMWPILMQVFSGYVRGREGHETLVLCATTPNLYKLPLILSGFLHCSTSTGIFERSAPCASLVLVDALLFFLCLAWDSLRSC